MRNFTPSNTHTVRGSQWLAIQAGFFCCYAKGSLSYKSARLYRVLRSTLPAQVVYLTAVFGGPFFCPPAKVKYTHVPSRNSHARRSATQGSRNAPGRGHYSHTAKTDEKVRECLEKTGVSVARHRGFQAILEPNTVLSTPVHTVTFSNYLCKGTRQHAIIMQKELKKRSTNVQEDTRRALDISRDEYALCSYVQYRAADARQKRAGWCCDDKDEIADFVGITRKGLYKMIARMELKGLIQTGAVGSLRVTPMWIDAPAKCVLSTQKEVGQKWELSTHEMGTKYTRNGNLVPETNKVLSKNSKNKEEDAKNSSATAKISHLEAEKKNENFLGAPAPPPPAEPTPRQINLTDRPNAKTPTELKEALSRFYAQWQNEWAFGVLENSRGRRYSKERQGEIVLAFCCHAIKSNRGGDTYQMLNADLQSWFLRQPEFEKNAQSTTLAPAPQPKQIIRIGQE